MMKGRLIEDLRLKLALKEAKRKHRNQAKQMKKPISKKTNRK